MDCCRPSTKLVFSSLYMLNLITICFSLNNEGIALLKFKEKLASDPFGALLNWRDQVGIENPCFWFGVECLENHVVSLNLNDLCLGGILPAEIGELIHIKSITLRNNSFSGVVPEEILGLDQLQVLDIGHNNFTGEIHYQLHEDSSMAIVLLDNNELLENRNPETYVLQRLSEVQVDKNLLFNHRHRALSCIQLSSISGNTQKASDVANRRSLQEPTLPAKTFVIPPPEIVLPPPLDLPLSPSTPDSPLAPTLAPNPSSGGPSEWPPEEAPVTPASSPSASTNHHRHINHHKLIIYATTGGSLLLFFVIGIVFWMCGSVATVKPWATGLSGQLQHAFVTGVPMLRRSELEVACEDFSNVIGSYPFWSLYKGTLSNGTEIAVASIAVASAKDWSNSLESQFRKKIATLSNVNHKNFASLIGYCVEDEPFTRMLVFEYAPNGTLFEHLHIKEAEHLDWATRLRIAMGIAYCLDHMHQLTPPFAHRNLNSSAVYLTEDYAAKVSDIAFFREASSSETEPNVSSNVYSFGVVLFEMMTGRLPYSAGGDSLEDWASDYLNGTQHLREMVDPTLESYNEDQLQQIGNVIRSCAGTDQRKRPKMREVCTWLREVTGIDPDGAVPRVSALWWAEVEIQSADAS